MYSSIRWWSACFMCALQVDLSCAGARIHHDYIVIAWSVWCSVRHDINALFLHHESVMQREVANQLVLAAWWVSVSGKKCENGCIFRDKPLDAYWRAACLYHLGPEQNTRWSLGRGDGPEFVSPGEGSLGLQGEYKCPAGNSKEKSSWSSTRVWIGQGNTLFLYGRTEMALSLPDDTEAGCVC